MARLCPALFIDQYGQHFYAGSLKELREKAGGGRLSKMYVDKKDGRPVHVGYVVGPRWFSAFRPVEIPE